MSGSAVDSIAGATPRARRRRSAPASAPAHAAPGAYAAVALPAGSVRRGPLNLVDQGISAAERSHAEVAIKQMFTAPGVDMVATYDVERRRYEIRSRTGLIAWERWATPSGELRYVVVEQTGENPIPSMDGRILTSLVEEIAAAGGAGKPVPKSKNSYPDIFERLSQLWDSPRAPDFVHIPTTGGDPNHPGAGSHGIPDVVQSRAPLIIAGPGIARGAVVDELVRSTDIAPTVAELLGVQHVQGTNASGVQRTQLLKWQDGRVLTGALAGAKGGAATLRGSAERAIIFTIDGMSQTVLFDEIAKGHLPNLARVIAAGTTFRNGSIVEYPTVTWANHNTIVSGAAPGHSGILNNSWFDRETQREQLITDGGFKNSLQTGKLMSTQVETLYEAVERSFSGATTIAVNQPSGRGADMSILDLQGVGNLLTHLPKIGVELLSGKLAGAGTSAVVIDGKSVSTQDTLGGAISVGYWDSAKPPKLGVVELNQVDSASHYIGPHSEEARQALANVDREVGKVLDALQRNGTLDSTAIVLTSDHGHEHQYTDPKKIGGWDEAIARAAAQGSVVKESTRFMYVRSMRVQVETVPTAKAGGKLRFHVVNDDQDASGKRPVMVNVGVTVTDATGKQWNAVSGPDGSVNLQIPAGAKGPLKVLLQHSEFSREELSIPLS